MKLPHDGHVAPARPDSLLTAALGGLMGVAGCTSDPVREPDPCLEPDAGVQPDTGAPHHVDDAGTDAGADAGPDGGYLRVISETPGQRTFADLTADCDARGGYVQIHAACAGTNACAGFSYGDWGEDALLTEHTCAGANGCNGLSCVVLPADTDPGHGRTGQQVFEAELATSGPAQSCTNCHSVSDQNGLIPHRFKIWTLPGSGRTPANWLDEHTVGEHERIVAFGSQGLLPNGQAFAHMSGYHRVLSRAEIQRVVEYLRSPQVTVEVHEYRIMD